MFSPDRQKILGRFTIAAIYFILVTCSFAQTGPPISENKREADLIELTKLDKSIRLDIRYATDNNFVGRAVYPEARAFLQRSAAEAVVRVQKLLKKEGLGLVIYDGYRPWAITKLFWEVVPVDQRRVRPPAVARASSPSGRTPSAPSPALRTIRRRVAGERSTFSGRTQTCQSPSWVRKTCR